jgi:hypothetical protein
MTDRTRSTLTQIAFVAVPALVAFAGSFAAVQASLGQKVDRVEHVTDIARLDREIDRRTAASDELNRRLDDIQRDLHALVCAQRPRPATCP